jgi:hypothetical protein
MVFFISCAHTSVLSVIMVTLQHFLINKTLHHVDSKEKYTTYIVMFHILDIMVNTVGNEHRQEYRN